MLARLPVRWLGMGAVMLATVLVGVADENELLTAFVRITPKTDDLVPMEATMRRIAKQVVPCTVGIQVGQNVEGSGVVISESGYVLTAAHVIGRPGRNVMIRFPDGTRVPGRTLGIHTEADGGLVKITKEGKWPFAPMVTHEDFPEPGDWCLSTGHPGGFQEDRTPPVRVGRIIDVDKDTLRSDCTITGGDSGGPLFDMQGRVIGIHSRISEESTGNLHGPVLAYVEAWEHLKAGETYPPVPPSRFLVNFDRDRDGKITRAELPAGDIRSMYDRLIESYELDAERAYSIEELAKAVGWRNVPPRLALTPYRPEDSTDSLDKKQFVRGNAVLATFKPIVSTAAKSTVEVLCDGKLQILGLVVSADGLVVTKASRLQGKITCRTPEGKKFAAKILLTDTQNDLAVLNLNATGLKPAEWADTDDLLPGRWLATPDVSGAAISVGVVSVAQRKIAGTPGVLGVQIRTQEKEGHPTIEAVMDGSGAKNAGMLANDVIVLVKGKPVRSFAELLQAVGEHRPGDVLKTTIERNGKTIEMEVRLGMRDDVFQNLMPHSFSGSDGLNGPLNQRRDDFPAAIQHDSVLLPSQCGGPIVNVSGRVIGINVARADRTVSYALPSETVMAIVEKAQAKLAETETNPTTTTN
ncbi:MAG TPA: trypsin-like peptidase domain-containing protein [Pirellulaceae bacterium]|nr:trypsin-like peptidase domain-containing protein [Pirellulaceae bacterium]